MSSFSDRYARIEGKKAFARQQAYRREQDRLALERYMQGLERAVTQAEGKTAVVMAQELELVQQGLEALKPAPKPQQESRRHKAWIWRLQSTGYFWTCIAIMAAIGVTAWSITAMAIVFLFAAWLLTLVCV
jgi:hypothetical protein